MHLPAGQAQRWRELREQRKLTTRELATRIGTTTGTVSNVERGVQKTIKRSLYTRWARFLTKEEQPTIPDDLWGRLVDTFLDVDEDEAERLIAVAAAIKKKR